MKKIIIVIIILVLLGAVIYFLAIKGRGPQQPAGTSKTGQKMNGQIIPTKKVIPFDPVLKVKNDLTVRARSFIERYGTWSNQSNFENFEDLLPYMTEKLRTETQTMITQKRAEQKSGQPYYGITTKMISLELKNLATDQKAEFSAKVQQTETKEGKTNILYKTANLTFVKVGADWKVESISI